MNFDEISQTINLNNSAEFKFVYPSKKQLQRLPLNSITIDGKQLFFYTARKANGHVIYNIVPNAISILVDEEKTGTNDTIIREVLAKPFLKPGFVFYKGYKVNVYRDNNGELAAIIV